MPDLTPEQRAKLDLYEAAFILAGREFLAQKLGGAALDETLELPETSEPDLPDAEL